MNANQNNEIVAKFYACQTCQGIGFVDSNFCPLCHGVGLAKPFRSSDDEQNSFLYLYWGRRVDSILIFQRRVAAWIGKIFTMVLILIGIAGIFSFLWPLARQALEHQVIDPYQELRSLFGFNQYRLFFLFWISLLFDLYLIYRWKRTEEKRKTVLFKNYEATPKEVKKEKLPDMFMIDWTTLSSLKEEQKIDIAETFSPDAIRLVEETWEFVRKLQLAEVEPLHLLTLLITKQRSFLVFSRLGLDIPLLISKVKNQLYRNPEAIMAPCFSLTLKQLFLEAYVEAYDAKRDLVGIDELLIVIARLRDNIVREIFESMEVTPQKVKNVVVWYRIHDILRGRVSHLRKKAVLRSKTGLDRAMTAVATPILNQMSTDLTMKAKYGHLPPLVGRDNEIEEIFRIIAGTSEGVILYGQPGVGKTAIIEGIAQRMVEDDVPKVLRDKRLVSLSLAKLISGATPSEAEARLIAVIESIERAGNIVLFIDNIEDMIGVTAGNQGSLDLSEVLSGSLQKHQFICLATAKVMEYHKYIEQSSSLSFVLHKVEIQEMDDNAAIQVLEAKASFIEYKQKIFFSYDALATAVVYADRYMHEQFLPAKALFIIEEAAVHVANKRGERAVVTAEDIAYIVAQKTKIPLTKITEKESEKLLKLEQVMHERMVDQEEAVAAVASALRRARAAIRDVKRPIANFLFLGPTGVGKTECAKTVAEVYFGDEENMIRVDMSEYQEKNSVERLIGAPPAPGGATMGGQLTEAVRKNPFSLLLLDEIEKAHPDILNIFLQVMEDGRLTDATGQTIDFTQTIIIMTSNAGTSYIQSSVAQGMTMEEMRRNLLETELKTYFRPEFLNRFDTISVFKPLEPEHVRQVARFMLVKIANQLEEKGIEFEVSDQAIRELASEGFDPFFGARPLRRVIQEQVSNLIANALLEGKLERRDKILLQGSGKLEIVKANKL